MTIRLPLKDLNELLTCNLCKGYYRDAHTILECMHTFCKSCVLSHFETNNIRGTIQCPQCETKLGLYGHVTGKMIYDRDLQSIVDKIFPKFALEEKLEEIKFYASRGIELKSETIKHNKEEETEQPAPKRAKLANGGGNSNNKAKSSNVAAVIDSKPPEKEAEQELEFTVKVNPCVNCEENLRLPALAKKLCKATLSIRVVKIKTFIHKRLSDEERNTISAGDIDILFNGEVLAENKRLLCLQKQVEQAAAAKTNIEFTYRRKKTESK